VRRFAVYPQETVALAMALRSSGFDATAIGRSLGVPKSTVQYWCRGGRGPDRRRRAEDCLRCRGTALDEYQYAFLLGHYLGDGHISRATGSVFALSIYCADDYPGVSAEVQEAVRAVMPISRVHVVARTGCHAVKSYTNHWPCLFPQHGPGMKHTRPIVLEPWQEAIVDREPGRLLRGLFHSDGCRITNWASKQTPDGPRRYEYPRYFFSNESLDILGICAAALDALGIAHRHPRWNMISVARREAVARLDEFVGPKY
jgi:hypothetical protein